MEYDDQPLDLSLPKKKTETAMTVKAKKEKTDSLFNDIEALVLPARKRNFIQTTDLQDPAVLERPMCQNFIVSHSVLRSTEHNGFPAVPSTNEIQNESTYEPTKKPSSCVEETVPPVDESNDSMIEAASRIIDDDDDDNCSTASDISLFAPSLSDSDSDIDDSIQATMNDNNRTNVWDLEVNDSMESVSEDLNDETMEEQIEEIFALTIKEMPKMISPLHDPFRLVIGPRCNTNTKRQLIEFRDRRPSIIEPERTYSHDIAEFADAAKRLKCQNLSSQDTELNQFQHTNESYAPLENDVGMTAKINSSQPLRGDKFKSKFDFKNLEKITINVGDRNLTRIVSIDKASDPVVAHSQPSLPAELVPDEEQTTVMPVSSLHVHPAEHPFIIRSATIVQPINAFQDVATHFQSALLAAPEPFQGLKSARIQSTTPRCKSPQPIDSVHKVVTRSQSAMRETLHEMQPGPILQPINLIQNVAAYSQPALPKTPTRSDGMQSVEIQSTPPQFQGSPDEKPMLISQTVDWFQENSTSSSTPTQRSDYWIEPETRHRYIAATLKLFEHPCINFLSNKPCAVPISCPYNHQLPNSEKILTKMHTYPNEKIHFIYQTFIAKSVPTFLQYFPWTCCLLGMRNMEATLASAVRDCDKYGKYDFYKFIFGGLLMCGKSDKEALGIMTDFVDICEENMAAMHEIMVNPTNPFIIQ